MESRLSWCGGCSEALGPPLKRRQRANLSQAVPPQNPLLVAPNADHLFKGGAALVGLIALGALRTLPALPPARAASLGVAEGHSVAIDGVIDDDPDARPA